MGARRQSFRIIRIAVSAAILSAILTVCIALGINWYTNGWGGCGSRPCSCCHESACPDECYYDDARIARGPEVILDLTDKWGEHLTLLLGLVAAALIGYGRGADHARLSLIGGILAGIAGWVFLLWFFAQSFLIYDQRFCLDVQPNGDAKHVPCLVLKGRP